MPPTPVKLTCIIDDDKIYITLFKKIIETKNLCKNIIVFNNGKESIDYFEAALLNANEEDIPDLIFLDLNMPIMDGWQFLERFNKIKNQFKKTITLYVVSSSINPVDIKRSKLLPNVENYLIKPTTPKKLEMIFKKTNTES